MSVRSHVPRPLRAPLKRAYLRVGEATAELRIEPSFIVIGAQRCGTTSIFRALSEHPQVLRPPVEKGIDYFTLHYGQSPQWYRSHFPVETLARARTRGSRPVAFEACTYYLFHPFALERLAHDFPAMRLVVMLRDPVERAYSAYKHELARGFETESSFEGALKLEDERLEGELERMRTDIAYESHAHRHQAYRRRGQYAEQLDRAFALFPREQIHVMESESFFADPRREFTSLTRFLELRSYLPERFDQHNARPGRPMAADTRRMLERHYAPHDEHLACLLGREPAWSRCR